MVSLGREPQDEDGHALNEPLKGATESSRFRSKAHLSPLRGLREN